MCDNALYDTDIYLLSYIVEVICHSGVMFLKYRVPLWYIMHIGGKYSLDMQPPACEVSISCPSISSASDCALRLTPYVSAPAAAVGATLRTGSDLDRL